MNSNKSLRKTHFDRFCSWNCVHTGWWSMAQLAAQDYFSRLQASGLSAFPHPADLAAAFPGGLAGMGATANNAGTSSSTNSRQNNGDSKGKGRKEKKSSSSNNNSGHNNTSMNNSSGLNLNTGTSSSPSSYKVWTDRQADRHNSIHFTINND